MPPSLIFLDLWLTAAHPVGQLFVALINGSEFSTVVLKVIQFPWDSEKDNKYLHQISLYFAPFRGFRKSSALFPDTKMH